MEIEVYRQADRLRDIHWWFLGRREVISSVLRKYLKQRMGKVLDLGCGAATSLPILLPFGDIYGVDKSKEAIQFCRNKGYYQLKEGDVASLPFGKNTFDLLAALDLLEHVKDDSGALLELARVCRKGGWVIITVPAFSFLWGENDLATHHFRRYEKDDLKRKIEQAGFSIKKLSYFNFFLFSLFVCWHLFYLVKRLFRKNFRPKSTLSISFSSLINQFLTFVFSQEAKLLPRIDFPLGLSLMCLARKE